MCSRFGTDGDDLLVGTPLNDILCGFGGNDRLEGGDGDDVLVGGDGDDVLVGGDGDDCLFGGRGTDSADTAPGEYGEGAPWDAILVDRQGGCIRIPPRHSITIGPRPSAGVTPGHGGEVGSAVGAGSSAQLPPRAADLRLGLPRGPLEVRRGVVRLRVSCSADVTGELVLLAGSRRVAHKRFICTAPEKTVRVRLNDAGRRLMARDDRVQARLLVLAAGRTVSQQVLLVSPDS